MEAGSILGKSAPSRGNASSNEEFQILLRGSDAAFRRFLIFLKFTGCRPGEAASMRWADVRFEEESVVLMDHKTARKTGRPRIIPLVLPFGLHPKSHHSGIAFLKAALQPCKRFAGLIETVVH